MIAEKIQRRKSDLLPVTQCAARQRKPDRAEQKAPRGRDAYVTPLHLQRYCPRFHVLQIRRALIGGCLWCGPENLAGFRVDGFPEQLCPLCPRQPVQLLNLIQMRHDKALGAFAVQRRLVGHAVLVDAPLGADAQRLSAFGRHRLGWPAAAAGWHR